MTLALFVVVRFFCVLRNKHAGLSVSDLRFGENTLATSQCPEPSTIGADSAMEIIYPMACMQMLHLSSSPQFLFCFHIILPKIYGLQIYTFHVETRLVVQNLFFNQSNMRVTFNCLSMRHLSCPIQNVKINSFAL